MYLRRLVSISDFRVFSGWSDQETERPHRFGVQTVLFGPNGCGKSTLADIAWCIEENQRDKPIDPRISGVSVELSDGTAYRNQTADSSEIPKLLVFCNEYVKYNLQKAFDEGAEGQALYVIGEKSADLEKQIKNCQREVELGKEESTRLATDLAAKKKAVDGVLEQVKKDVAERLAFYDPDRYNTNTFNVTKARALLAGDRRALDSEALERAANELRITAADIPNDIDFSAPRFPLDLVSAARDCATYSVTSIVIESLADDPMLADWVGKGLSLHRDTTICGFCSSKIPPGRLQDLDAHFDKSHRRLQEMLEELSDQMSIFKSHNKDWKQALADIGIDSTRIQSILKLHEGEVLEYGNIVGDWISAAEAMIESRKSHPHRSFVWTPLERPTSEIWSIIEQTIKAVNKDRRIRRDTIGEIKKAAEETLLRHIAAKHYDIYSGADNDAKVSTATLDNHNTTIDKLESKLRDLISKRASKDDGEKLALALSKDLICYFGHTDLTVRFVKDPSKEGFVFLRNEHPARNLSEGERNAIALLHFLRSLDSLGIKETLSECCVIIDDPVSSLDHDSIIAAFSFLISKLRDDNGHLRCCQFVILTHNFEFFRLWKDALGKALIKDKKKARKENIQTADLPMRRAAILELLIRNEIVEGDVVRRPLLRDLGTELRALTSEYYYLFARACESTNPANEELLPLTGNSTRRLLESFLKFKLPDETNFTQAAERLGTDLEINREIVRQVIIALHGASHRTEIDIHSASFRAGIVKDISATLEFIRAADSMHFEGMCSSTGYAPFSLRSP